MRYVLRTPKYGLFWHISDPVGLATRTRGYIYRDTTYVVSEKKRGKKGRERGNKGRETERGGLDGESSRTKTVRP